MRAAFPNRLSFLGRLWEFRKIRWKAHRGPKYLVLHLYFPSYTRAHTHARAVFPAITYHHISAVHEFSGYTSVDTLLLKPITLHGAHSLCCACHGCVKRTIPRHTKRSGFHERPLRLLALPRLPPSPPKTADPFSPSESCRLSQEVLSEESQRVAFSGGFSRSVAGI